MVVVDALEVIDVDHQHRGRWVERAAAQDRPSDHIDRMPVQQAGQGIGIGGLAQQRALGGHRQHRAEHVRQGLEQPDAHLLKVVGHIGIQRQQTAVGIDRRGQRQRHRAADAVHRRRLAPRAVQRHPRHVEGQYPLARQRAERRPDLGEKAAIYLQLLGVGRCRPDDDLRHDGWSFDRAEPGPGQAHMGRGERQCLAHPEDDVAVVALLQQARSAAHQRFGNAGLLPVGVEAGRLGGVLLEGQAQLHRKAVIMAAVVPRGNDIECGLQGSIAEASVG